MNASQKIYDHALKDLGLHERPGPASQPRIAQAIKVAADWLDQDDSKTAWCGCIRGLWGLETGTGVPKDHFRAASWLNWGAAVPKSSAVKGDTVVMSRPGGHHVALLDRFEGHTVWLLGGNQSDGVTLAAFAAERIDGIRRG